MVRLRKELRWFEYLPLFGKRIIITRELQEQNPLSEILELNGAEIVLLPTIAMHPPDSYQSLDEAIAQLQQFQWVIFTSTNGVRFFMDRLLGSGRGYKSPQRHLIAAIGSGTARTLNSYYIQADLVPDEFSAEGVVSAFTQQNISGVKSAYPQSPENARCA